MELDRDRSLPARAICEDSQGNRSIIPADYLLYRDLRWRGERADRKLHRNRQDLG